MAAVVVLSTVGPVSPVAAHAGHGPVSISQSTGAGDLEPGDDVTVQATINATGLDAPVVDLTLPSGWTVESYTMVDGPSPIEFKEQTNEWLWFEAPASQSYTIQYTVSVPANATDGTYAIDAEGSAFDPDADETVADTTSTSVTVVSADENQAPSAAFDWTPSSPGAGETVTFDASGAEDPDGAIDSYEWDLDADGEFEETGETVDHVFDAAGTHEVSLRVTDDGGAIDESTETVTVVTENAAPSVTLTADPASVESGTAVDLAADAADPDDDELSYAWEQLSGPTNLTLPEGENGTVTPPEAGTYELSVTVEDAEGATASDTATIEATEPNEPPSADFEWTPDVPTAGETVTFDASTSSDADGNVTTYEWDFDADGNVDDATTSSTTTHTFESAGEHSVVLQVTDGDGATDDATGQVTVEAPNEPPTAAFEWTPPNPDPGETVTFDASGAEDPDGAIESYAWDLDGDGEPDATGQQVTHTFDSGGEQEVALAVSDDEGATDATARTVAVGATNQPPAVELDARPSTVTVGDEVELEAAAGDPNGDEVVVSWEQLSGPANLALPEGTSGTVTPPESGTYQVQVTVEDPEGASDSATVAIEATANELPVAAFDYSPGAPKKGERVSFDATASDDPDGRIASYAWDLDGDGEFEESGRTVSYAFGSPGAHEVTLRVTDDRGATDEETRTVEVRERDRDENEAPTATLEVNVPYADEPVVEVDDPVTFDASNSTDPDGDDDALAFEWSVVSAPPDASLPAFEGESTETVYFETPGNYTVEVTVTDGDGGTDSATADVRSKFYPTLHVDAVTVEEGSIEVGETAHVNATVHNSGTGVGSANFSLLVDGEEVDVESVEAGTEERLPLVFEQQFDEPGTYELTVLNAADDDATGESFQLQVEESTTDAGGGGGTGGGSGSGPSNSAPSSDTESDGDEEGTTTDDEAGTSDQVDSTTPDSTDTTTSDGTESASKREGSTATTTSTPEPTATASGTESPGQPGFGVAIAALALLAAALLARRRS